MSLVFKPCFPLEEEENRAVANMYRDTKGSTFRIVHYTRKQTEVPFSILKALPFSPFVNPKGSSGEK